MRSKEELFDSHGFKGFTSSELLELQEKFVQSRFAEKTWFNRPDIEEWFHKREQAPIEISEIEVWRELLDCSRKIAGRFGECSDKEAIRRYGARYPVDVKKLPEDFYEEEGASAMNVHLDHMVKSGLWDLYIGDGVTCLGKFSDLTLIFEHASASGCGTWRLHHIEALLSIFLAQACGKDDRRLAADVFLRETLGRCIAHVRTEAEKDFAAATAVSPDGNIVCVDRVLLLSEGRNGFGRFPSSMFSSHKIFLDKSAYERLPGQFSEQELFERCTILREGRDVQFFASMREGRTSSDVLCVSAGFLAPAVPRA